MANGGMGEQEVRDLSGSWLKLWHIVFAAVVLLILVIWLAAEFPAMGTGIVAGATVLYVGLTYMLVKHAQVQSETAAAGLAAQQRAMEQQFRALQAQIDAAARQVSEATRANAVAVDMYSEAVRGRLDPLAPKVTVTMVDRAPEVVEVKRDREVTTERPTEVVMGQNWFFHLRWQIEVVNYGDLPVKMWVTNTRIPEDERGHQVLPPRGTKMYPLDHIRTAHPGPQRMIEFLLQFTDVQDNIQDTHRLTFWPPVFREDGNVLRINWSEKANVIPLAQISRDYVYVRRAEREAQQAAVARAESAEQ